MVIEKEGAKEWECRRIQKIYCNLKKRIGFNDQFCINYLGNMWVQKLVYEVYYKRLDFENLIFNVQKKIKLLGLEKKTKSYTDWYKVLDSDILGV